MCNGFEISGKVNFSTFRAIMHPLPVQHTVGPSYSLYKKQTLKNPLHMVVYFPLQGPRGIANPAYFAVL